MPFSFLKNFLGGFFPEPDPEPEPPAPTLTIGEIASGNENFETLAQALTLTNSIDGLLDTALAPGADITVFAPTDDAFRDLAAAKGVDVTGLTDAEVANALADALGPETVSQVLKYHVKIGGSTVAELEAEGTIATLVDAPGLATTFTLEDGELVDADPDIEDPEFIDGLTDIAASNGVIHAIDKVLLPVDGDQVEVQPTIADIAVANEDFEILEAALIATNGINGLLDAASNPDANVTVFAPTDDAFKALAATLGIDPATELGIDPADVVDADYATALATVLGAETVSDLLSYHVLGDDLRLDDLQAVKAVQTLNGDYLSIDGTTVVDAEPQIEDATIVLQDVEASNGQIQAIDSVLLPFDLDPQDLRLKGTFKADVLQGGGGDDHINGRFGHDVLNGGAGDDKLLGKSGADILIGGAGDDRSFGGRGHDTLIDGEGDDFFKGGWGRDKFDFTGLDGDNTVADFRGNDLLVFSAEDYADAEDVLDNFTFDDGGAEFVAADGSSVFLNGVGSLDESDILLA